MKKKTLTIVFTLCLFLCSIMLFTSYSYKKHKHKYEKNWSIDEKYHWYKCVGCEKITNKQVHMWNAGVITIGTTETIEGEKIYTCKYVEKLK